MSFALLACLLPPGFSAEAAVSDISGVRPYLLLPAWFVRSCWGKMGFTA